MRDVKEFWVDGGIRKGQDMQPKRFSYNRDLLGKKRKNPQLQAQPLKIEHPPSHMVQK